MDYLLKPVDRVRLRETLRRAQERIKHADQRDAAVAKLGAAAAAAYQSVARSGQLDRIPIRTRDEVTFVAVADLASVVAEGELLHLFTMKLTRHTINYRLKDLETRVDSRRFVRVARGTLINLDALVKVTSTPGGDHVAVLGNGQNCRSAGTSRDASVRDCSSCDAILLSLAHTVRVGPVDGRPRVSRV